MPSERPSSRPAPRSDASSRRARRVGVLIGGSGLVGGTLLHHFKKGGQQDGDGSAGPFAEIELLAPNSKELSLRVRSDIQSYFEKTQPDFIVNCAIAALGSDPELTFEINCMGAVYLARAALELGIPYIHISSGAVMPSGENLPEEARLSLSPKMPNYAKGKLLAELALERMHTTLGLDYTGIRLGIVYGGHDHKIQGFHHLLFAIVDGSMPALLTSRHARHSYSNARKLPHLVAHVLDHREEFTGQIHQFVDPEPVCLGELILTLKRQLGTPRPREIYVPYGLARIGVGLLSRIARLVSRFGIEARPPAEAVFLRNFYETQVLSGEKLRRSSFIDPDPDVSLFTELPALIDYYVPRWEHLNLVEPRSRVGRLTEQTADQFAHAPEKLLVSVVEEQDRPLLRGASSDRLQRSDEAPHRSPPRPASADHD